MYYKLIRRELNETALVLDQFSKNETNIQLIQDAATMIANSFKLGGKLLSCGNGGSHCEAMHFAEELTGKYRKIRPSYPAIAISDVSHISCVSNDFGYNYVFSRYIEAIGHKNDILLGISTSGNSSNIIEAIRVAKEKEMKVIALTGKNGGQIAQMASIEIRIPYFGYSEYIQEIHMKVIHILIQLIEKEMTK